MSDKNMMLLNSIDSIDELVFESECQVLDAMYDEYTKLMILNEYSTNVDESVSLFMEGDFSTAIGKIGKGIGKVFRKLFELIKACLNAIKNLFKRLFGHVNEKPGNATKTTNQILSDIQKGEIKLAKPTTKAPTNITPVKEDTKPTETSTPTETPTQEPTPAPPPTPTETPAPPIEENVETEPVSDKVDSTPKQDESVPKEEEVVSKKASSIKKSSNPVPVKTISIPAHEASDPACKGMTVKVYDNNIFIGINNNREFSINFFRDVRNTIKTSTRKHDSRFEGSSEEWLSYRIDKCLSSLINQELFLKFVNAVYASTNTMFEMLDKAKTNDEFVDLVKDSDWSKNIDIVDRMEKEFRKLDNVKYKVEEIKNADIMNFQKVIDECLTKFDSLVKFCDILDRKIGIITNQDNYNILKRQEKLYNDVLLDFFCIQIGLSAINSAYDGKWLPDEKYFGTVKDLATLDTFVNELIKNHVPQKEIMKAAWLVSAPEIRGDDNEYKPIWGMMRGCFIPPREKFVYKIALSQRSIIDNKNECMLTDRAKKSGYTKIITQVIQHTDNYAANKLEKVYGFGVLEKDHKLYDACFKYICDEFVAHETAFDLDDLHHKNIAFRKAKPSNGSTYTVQDEPVILDYGQVIAKK